MNTRLHRSRFTRCAFVLVNSVVVSLPLSTAARGDDEPPAAHAIFAMKPDGSEVRRVALLEGFRRLGAPRFSHDGKLLAFAAAGDKTSRCLVVETTDNNLRDLGAGAMPDWSPDDKQIVFEAAPEAKAGVWVQNVDGRGKTWLADGRGPRWAPDGRRIAILGPLRVLDLVEGGARAVVDPASKLGEVLGCEWSPDGKRLAAVVERDGTRELVIIDLDGGAKKIKSRLAANLDGALGWSPDGKQLAVSIRDPKLEIWRLHLVAAEGNAPAVVIPGQEGDNRQPAWSPDGSLLAFASSRTGAGADPLAVAKPAARLQLVRRHDKGGTVYSVAFSPDGQIAFLGGDMAHRRMQVWDVAGGTVVRTINVPGIFVSISPDGRWAACAEFIGGGVQYLDLEDGSVVREFAHGAQVISLEFSRDGSRLVSAGVDKKACVFDVARGAELVRVTHDGELKSVAFSPDGKLFASACTDKKVHLWDAATGRKVRELAHPATPWSVAFSPDGRQIMTATGGDLVGKRSDLLVAPSQDNAIRFWDVATGKPVRKIQGHTNVVSGLAYSPDGKLAVSASFDRTLRLWDVESGRALSRADGQGWFTKAVFSFDGRFVLAGGGAEKNVDQRIWLEFPDERVRLYAIVP